MITFIGISHLDLDGSKRLKQFLDYLKPELIGLETTEEELQSTEKLIEEQSKPEVISEGIINLIKHYPKINYETAKAFLENVEYDHKVVFQYSKEQSVPIFFADSDKELKKIDELHAEINSDNDFSFLDKSTREFLEKTLIDAKKEIDTEYSWLSYPVKDLPELQEFYQKRDEIVEQKIRSEKKSLVYICGLDHIYGDYTPNLFDRLKDLNPRRYRLSAIDSLDNFK